MLAALVRTHNVVPMDNLGGDLVVKATIDGRGPFNLVLDTGAGATVLTPRAFRALKMRVRGKGTASGFGARTVHDQQVTLDRLAVGGADARNVFAVVIDLPPDLTYQGRYGTIDGILGYTFLKNFVVTLDYARRRAAFDLPVSVSANPDGQRLAMTLVNGSPAIHAKILDVSALLEIDSGNSGISIAAARFAQKTGLLERGCRSAEQTHEGVGGFVSTPLVRVREIRVGRAAIPNVAIAVSPGREKVLSGASVPDVVLGNDFLHRFTISIDYPNSTVLISANADAYSYKPFLTTGLSPQRRNDGSLFVQSVSTGSAAAGAGIRAGDEIISINAIPAKQLSDRDIARATGSGQITYVIRSGRRVRTVALTLHDSLPPCGGARPLSE